MPEKYVNHHLNLWNFSKTGQIERLRMFLEEALPDLSEKRRLSFCRYINNNENSDDRCIWILKIYADGAAEGDQTEVFEYLWDTYLYPGGVREISWRSLKAAASHGSISLAQAFWSRDPDCFTRSEPKAPWPFGPPEGCLDSQFDVAIRRDRFEYIDYMLSHGGDINGNFPPGNILARTLRWSADDSTLIQRIRFLLSRGARMGEEALRGRNAGSDIKIINCLLDADTDPDESTT